MTKAEQHQNTELVPKHGHGNGNGNLALKVSIEEIIAKRRAERSLEATPRLIAGQALEHALHGALESYQLYRRSVELADYEAFSRVLSAALAIAPMEFIDQTAQLRAQVDQFIAAMHAARG